MPLPAGTRLGPYEIVSLLGTGGMGHVYQARDERLNRQVALKVLPPNFVGDDERRRRFVQEAQLASSLQHPNIVTIFDIGTADGTDYLAMELVRGRTLEAVIPKKGLRLPEALRYAIQITDALAAAHAAGIIHRDLKPSNMMVTDQGQIKILDFGLATLTETPFSSPADETRAQAVVVTGDNAILGTVAYMSPEQAEGKKIDARSDIFSFGAIFYEMLSGQRAFRADSTPGTLAAVINLDPPALTAVTDDLPQPVERLVSRCLRKDVARRAQHASDIKIALEDLQEDSISGSKSGAVTSGPVVPARRSRRLAVAAGIGLIAVVAVVAAFVWWPRAAPAGATVLSPVQLTSLPGFESVPTFSPDGSQIAFAWQRENAPTQDIHVLLVGAGGSPLRLTDDGSTHGIPSWAPDGKVIAFWHLPPGGPGGPGAVNATLSVVSPLGGTERQVLEWNGSLRRISWSPDSRWLVLSPVGTRNNQGDGITFVSIATGERMEWAKVDPAFKGSADPALSPDGRQIAFVRFNEDFSGDLFVAPVGPDGKPGGAPRHVPMERREALVLPVWTADGREVLVVAGTATSNGGVLRVPIDRSRPPERLRGLERAANLAISRDGRRLAFSRSRNDGDVWRLDLREPASSGRIAASTLWDEGADFSADGRRIAFSSNRSGAREIWVADVTGENALPLTSFDGPVPGTARWSPDSRQVVFDARPDGNSDIFVAAAGGGAVRQLTKEPGEDARPAWSHDGRWIYFTSTRSGPGEIWRMAPDGSNPSQITRQGAFAVVASRDGEWLYYQTGPAPLKIRKIRPDGSGDAEVIAEPSISLNFTATASGLWFVSAPVQAERVLKVLRFADNRIHEVVKIGFSPVPVGLSISPDERYALVTRGDTDGSDLLLVNDFR